MEKITGGDVTKAIIRLIHPVVIIPNTFILSGNILTEPECSITGGYVYRGVNVPELIGKYIYGDYCSRKIWSLEYDGINPPTNELLVTAPGLITSFGVDENSEIYITSSNGIIYRFTPTVDCIDLNLNSGWNLVSVPLFKY